jgi:glycosyltransferase involved in cell wall biosynthesis
MIGVQTPYLFTAGTLEPRKDHATLLAAFERSRIRQPSLSLVIAGPTGWLPDEGMYSKPGVIRLGHISNSYLDVLYREAAIVVAPSIYEGFDLVVLEALARGRPVIASRIPPHVELAGNAACFFPPRDVDTLARCIDELLGDPDARDELGRAAALRSKRFSVDCTIAGHLAAYERAAGVPHRTSTRTG